MKEQELDLEKEFKKRILGRVKYEVFCFLGIVFVSILGGLFFRVTEISNFGRFSFSLPFFSVLLGCYALFLGIYFLGRFLIYHFALEKFAAGDFIFLKRKDFLMMADRRGRFFEVNNYNISEVKKSDVSFVLTLNAINFNPFSRPFVFGLERHRIVIPTENCRDLISFLVKTSQKKTNTIWHLFYKFPNISIISFIFLVILILFYQLRL